MNYEETKASIAAASSTPIALPAYEGSAGDLTYLKSYILGLVTARYGVAEGLFDTASAASTTLLRDFVHRALYDRPNLQYYVDLFAQGLAPNVLTHVGAAFEVSSWMTCGNIAWQLQNVYRALGYDASVLWVVDGEDGVGTPFSYQASHAIVEVETSDNGRIVQDVTFNFSFVDDATGDVLSLYEAQRLNKSSAESLAFDDTGIFTYVGYFGVTGWLEGEAWPVGGQEQFYRDSDMNTVFAWKRAPDWSMQKIDSISDWSVKHTAVFAGAYGAAAEALVDVTALRLTGASLVGITDALRPDHAAVSGFRLVSDGGAVAADFVTVQLQDGAYISINIDTGEVLNGSYDQIMDDVVGTGRDLNPGLDLSYFIGSTLFIGFDGKVIVDWTLNDDAEAVAPLLAERVSRDTGNVFMDGRSVAVSYDRSDMAWTDITSIYRADGMMEAQIITMDSGTEFRSTFDAAGAQIWASKMIRFTDFGETAAIRFEYDAGGALQLDYDFAETQVWSVRSTRANSAGAIEALLYEYDAGGRLSVTYDLVGTQIWSSSLSRYNGANQLEAQSVNYDAGGHFDSIYDVGNAHLWQTLFRRFNTLNNLEAEVYKFDDGRKASYFYDHTGAEPWQFYVDTYSPEGELISHKFKMDDGSIV